jgi:glycosyltransferase involved in cell wall biosynthesis
MGSMQGVEHSVVSLAPPVGFSELFREAGVATYHLNLGQICNPFGAAEKLTAIIESSKPDVIQSWLYHANLISALSIRSMADKAPPLIWGLRGSLVRFTASSIPLWLVILWTRCIAATPSLILANSPISIQQHIKLGYPSNKMRFLPNGFDADKVFRSEDARSEIRSQLGIGDNDPVIAVCGRADPSKGFPLFLRAFAKICQETPTAVALMIGRGLDESPELTALISELGIRERVRRIGYTNTPQHYMSAADIGCSSSITEGFPNVVAESMLCELPMVVTDVGMSRDIVGEHGVVVAAGNVDLLAQGLSQYVTMGVESRKHLGRLSRNRIQEHFGLPAILSEMRGMYEELVKAH